MDHYSRKVLGYCIEKSSSGTAIRGLLQNAYTKHKPKNTLFLTDAGPENLNTNVETFIKSTGHDLLHRVAQRDVSFSNSMIEAFNRVLKYQFLFPKDISCGKQLRNTLDNVIEVYNNDKPQLNLGGSTPSEVFFGNPIDFKPLASQFKGQQQLRVAKNRASNCKTCL